MSVRAEPTTTGIADHNHPRPTDRPQSIHGILPAKHETGRRTVAKHTDWRPWRSSPFGAAGGAHAIITGNLRDFARPEITFPKVRSFTAAGYLSWRRAR